MKILVYVIFFVWITNNSFADSHILPKARKGGSGGGFASHAFKLQNLPIEKFPLCERSVGSVFSLKNLGRWVEIEYTVASDREPEKVIPFLLEITSRMVRRNEDFKFLPYGEMKSKAILNAMTIDSRIVISYDKNLNHSLLGSKYVVLNVDSVARLVYFKHELNDAVFSVK